MNDRRASRKGSASICCTVFRQPDDWRRRWSARRTRLETRSVPDSQCPMQVPGQGAPWNWSSIPSWWRPRRSRQIRIGRASCRRCLSCSNLVPVTFSTPLTVTELEIHGEPFRARARARLAKRKLGSRATSDERAPFRQRTGRSGVELSDRMLSVRGMERRQLQMRTCLFLLVLLCMMIRPLQAA
jgi:hypothetical protein